MVAGVALLAACTLGLGLAIEPAVQLSRVAAKQLTPDAAVPNVAPSVGTARPPR
jgi:hypothetical protein